MHDAKRKCLEHWLCRWKLTGVLALETLLSKPCFRHAAQPGKLWALEVIAFDADFVTAAKVRRSKYPSPCLPFYGRPLSLGWATAITHRLCPAECRCRR